MEAARPSYRFSCNLIQEREETGTLNREIQDLKELLEVNELQNRMENLQEQLRDKEKQMGSLKRRIKSLQADTSNTDTVLTTLVESLAAKEHIIQRLKDQRFQEKGEELVATRTTLERMKGEHKMALVETAARHKARSMDWFREREALKAQLLGLMKEPEENRQVAQQLSFNFQERDEREHLICKRNWLEVEERRLDADYMELQFLERERQRIRFERRRERYGIQRESKQEACFKKHASTLIQGSPGLRVRRDPSLWVM
ncbi:unnamed protein product [Boreogadus saida]